MRILALLAIFGHCEEVDVRCDCDPCSPNPNPQKLSCGVDVVIAIESTNQEHFDESVMWTNQLRSKMSTNPNLLSAVTTFGNESQFFDFDSDFDASFIGGDVNYQSMVEAVSSQMQLRSTNNRYKTVLLISNGNNVSAEETKRLSKVLFQNDVVDLVIPIMISQSCHESTETPNCPNLENLQLWINPDSDPKTMPESIQSSGAIRSIMRQLESLTQMNPKQCKISHYDIKYDMTILIDGSDSIHRRDWQYEIKPALKNWIKSYPESLVTVKQFSIESRVELGPLIPARHKSWPSKIDNMEQMASSTYLHNALVDITSDEFAKLRQDELTKIGEKLYNRFRILLIVSDGWPHNEQLNPPSLDDYDFVVIVGIGTDIRQEFLSQLGSMVELAEIKNYGQLRLKLSQLKKKVEVRLRSMMAVRNRSKRRTDLLNANQGPNFSSECVNGICNCRCYTPIIKQYYSVSPGKRGPPGKQGPRGEPGAPGPDGLHGRDGERGKRGGKGIPGEDGPNGIDGPRGPPGLTGRQGQAGEKGPPGPPGQASSGLVIGVEGDVGERGPTGEPGEVGENGANGENGQNGNPGRNGVTGSRGESGPNGHDGIGHPGNDGACGEMGYSGLTGNPGKDGQNGADGLNGANGPQGAAGDAGPKGQKGEKGRQGENGDEGECGEHGQTGPQGEAGPQGETGDQGQNGHDGPVGPKGEPGVNGIDGIEGLIGLPGLDGLLGSIGLPGLPGLIGDIGEPGDDGIDGDDGPDGSPGEHGDIGEKGQKGRRGITGLPGVVDLDQHYLQIKGWVKQRMIQEGWKCERCKEAQKTTTTTTTTTTSTTTTITTTSTTTVQPSLHPINLVVLLDGSDSIRSSKKEELDEWSLALSRVNDFVDAFKLGQRNERQEDYLSFVQFSRDVKGHLLGVPIDSLQARNEYKEIIMTTEQMKKTTNTYKALDYVSQIEDKFNSTVPFDLVNILIVITDGEARDDRDQAKMNEILANIQDYYDFVIPMGVGPNYDERQLG